MSAKHKSAEQNISFNSENETIKLEGLLARQSGKKGIVVTHPHPLYGGDMYNPVVEAIVRAFQKKGYTTLRFNFRGVGRSQGKYDDGHGEQRDVRAALAYLKNLSIEHLNLAGYSFGAWVCYNLAAVMPGVKNMVMVSPPVGLIDFSPQITIPCLRLVITGSQDNDIAPAHRIRQLMPVWNPDATLKIVKGADHFYTGSFSALESYLNDCEFRNGD
jgi:alpha/beta superfamily hydrolase